MNKILNAALSFCLVMPVTEAAWAQSAASSRQAEESVASGFAQRIQPSDFLMRGSEGWFWYEDPPEPITIEPKEPEKPATLILEKEAESKPAPSEEPGPDPFSVEWLRVSMPILLDEAINNPTKENVEAYEYAKRVMLDKSQRYAEMTQQVVANDPYLDENNRVPFATFAKKAFLSERTENLTKAMKYLSDIAGIWMFFDSTCNFCHLQANQILSLGKDYNFQTRFISMNGKGMSMLPEYYVDSGQAKKIGLTMTPTTVMVVPPNQYFIISQGAMARDQLEERILIAADSNDLLPDELRAGTRAFDKGVLRTEDLQDIGSDDPKEWVKRLKEKLKGRY